MRPVWKEICARLNYPNCSNVQVRGECANCVNLVSLKREKYFFLLNSQFKTGKCSRNR